MRLNCKNILSIFAGLFLGLFVATPGFAAGESSFEKEGLDLAKMTMDRMRDTRLETQAARRVEFSKEWIDSLPEPSGGEELECLAEALYFEARGEPIKGIFHRIKDLILFF